MPEWAQWLLFVSLGMWAVAKKYRNHCATNWVSQSHGCLTGKYRTLLDSPQVAAHSERRSPLPATSVASTGTKDPNASDVLYVEALALPFTINTMPEATLKALAEHEEVGEAQPGGREEGF